MPRQIHVYCRGMAAIFRSSPLPLYLPKFHAYATIRLKCRATAFLVAIDGRLRDIIAMLILRIKSALRFMSDDDFSPWRKPLSMISRWLLPILHRDGKAIFIIALRRRRASYYYASHNKRTYSRQIARLRFSRASITVHRMTYCISAFSFRRHDATASLRRCTMPFFCHFHNNISIDGRLPHMPRRRAFHNERHTIFSFRCRPSPLFVDYFAKRYIFRPLTTLYYSPVIFQRTITLFRFHDKLLDAY